MGSELETRSGDRTAELLQELDEIAPSIRFATEALASAHRGKQPREKQRVVPLFPLCL